MLFVHGSVDLQLNYAFCRIITREQLLHGIESTYIGAGFFFFSVHHVVDETML